MVCSWYFSLDLTQLSLDNRCPCLTNKGRRTPSCNHAGSQRDRYSYMNRPDRFVITIEFNIQEHSWITFQMVWDPILHTPIRPQRIWMWSESLISSFSVGATLLALYIPNQYCSGMFHPKHFPAGDCCDRTRGGCRPAIWPTLIPLASRSFHQVFSISSMDHWKTFIIPNDLTESIYHGCTYINVRGFKQLKLVKTCTSTWAQRRLKDWLKALPDAILDLQSSLLAVYSNLLIPV